MSELPPNIDAILASIRSRMNEDGGGPPPPPAPPPLMATPDVPLGDIGGMEIAPAPAPDAPAPNAPAAALTLEGLVRSMLEPLLKAWLDANMPEIVEKQAQAEIKRLTGH